jgi:hypothetical protein
MFDIALERPIRIEEAARLANTHFSTVFRWILKGAKNPSGQRVRLQGCRLGGKWVTSKESLKRFSEALTPIFDDTPMSTARTGGQRKRGSERAAKELERAGI